MEMKNVKLSLQTFFDKYKYVIFVVLIGFALMLIPFDSVKKNDTRDSVITIAEERDAEEALEGLISHIKGAGKVKVMLTQKTGQQIIYQSDDDISTGADNSSSRNSTVVITDQQRNQNGLIKQKNPPQYLGAVVVCQGADSPNVRLAVINAVSSLTGLGADSICVIKMK